MEIKIIEDHQKPLLARRELLIEVSFEGKTPSRLEMKKELSDNLKINQDLISIKNIKTQFGYRKANIVAHVYQNKKDLEALEPKHITKRHLPKEKKEAKPAEAKKEEEKPEEKAEEKKEEKPEEKKEEPKKQEKQEEKKEEPKEEKAKQKEPPKEEPKQEEQKEPPKQEKKKAE